MPAGNPNSTLYRQFLLIGIDLNNTPLNALPVLTTEQITQIATALGLTNNPYQGAQPIASTRSSAIRGPRSSASGSSARC